MFNINFLHQIRAFEYDLISGYFHSGARILEIGGGTGYQARKLSDDGFDVVSIDLPDSTYAGNQEFPVQFYDGRNFPFPDKSFDIVFSSNVLEHVRDLDQLQQEILRVLKPGGYCIHLMPTGSWRFWTNITHYISMVQTIAAIKLNLSSLKPSSSEATLSQAMRRIVSILRHGLIVPRHGEWGNALTEISTFGASSWSKRLLETSFQMEEITPVGLFYTGHMVLGTRLSIKQRQCLSRFFGSACILYKVRPINSNL